MIVVPRRYFGREHEFTAQSIWSPDGGTGKERDGNLASGGSKVAANPARNDMSPRYSAIRQLDIIPRDFLALWTRPRSIFDIEEELS
jgi:hypothetical protein